MRLSRLQPTTGEARQRRIRTRIGVMLKRDGELPTSWIVQGVRGSRDGFTRAEIERAICDLYLEGIIACERRRAPTHHGAKFDREWTYWRPADAPAGEGR